MLMHTNKALWKKLKCVEYVPNIMHIVKKISKCVICSKYIAKEQVNQHIAYFKTI